MITPGIKSLVHDVQLKRQKEIRDMMKKKREKAVLVDRISRWLFPTSFILLNIVYWALFGDHGLWWSNIWISHQFFKTNSEVNLGISKLKWEEDSMNTNYENRIFKINCAWFFYPTIKSTYIYQKWKTKEKSVCKKECQREWINDNLLIFWEANEFQMATLSCRFAVLW